MPATATVNGRVIAQADHWETLEGNIYVSPVDTTVMAPFGSTTNKHSFHLREYATVHDRLNIKLMGTSSVEQSVLIKTDTTTACPWKGLASYYTINVDGTLVLFDKYD